MRTVFIAVSGVTLPDFPVILTTRRLPAKTVTGLLITTTQRL